MCSAVYTLAVGRVPAGFRFSVDGRDTVRPPFHLVVMDAHEAMDCALDNAAAFASDLPICPLCRGLARPNVRLSEQGDAAFVPGDQQHYSEFRAAALVGAGPLVIVEVGCGGGGGQKQGGGGSEADDCADSDDVLLGRVESEGLLAAGRPPGSATTLIRIHPQFPLLDGTSGAEGGGSWIAEKSQCHVISVMAEPANALAEINRCLAALTAVATEGGESAG